MIRRVEERGVRKMGLESWPEMSQNTAATVVTQVEHMQRRSAQSNVLPAAPTSSRSALLRLHAFIRTCNRAPPYHHRLVKNTRSFRPHSTNGSNGRPRQQCGTIGAGEIFTPATISSPGPRSSSAPFRSRFDFSFFSLCLRRAALVSLPFVFSVSSVPSASGCFLEGERECVCPC